MGWVALRGTGGLSYLYARVLCSEVDGVVAGRVGEAEDVANVVGRPECVAMLEGGRAPDLKD